MAQNNYRHRKSEGDLRRRLYGGNVAMPSDHSDDTGGEDDFDVTPYSGSEPMTYIIVSINSTSKPETLKWLVNKIRGKRDEGGAELIVRQQIPEDKDQDIMLHVTASKIKLLESAEQLELQKRDKYNRIRDFSVEHLEDFLLDDNMTVDDLLTTSEKQTIVKHELENIRATAHEACIPGYSNCTLYEGQSVFHECLNNNIITHFYPLHEKDVLKKLGHQWYRSFIKQQPIEEIRTYFGEAIALYFTFLHFYTIALLFPMILGFLQLIINSTESVPFFCGFNVLWTTIFLELWKRKSNELAFNWGTIGMTSLDEPRANYHGQMKNDPVTGKIRPQYPRWKTNAKMYLVSLPIVLICMIFAFVMMLASFWCEDLVRNIESEYSETLLQIPSIIYAVLVFISNVYYRQFATFLTEWENHRTQSQYDRHRVTKLVLFEFVNNFMSLFYIAFIIQDFQMLKSQLAIMLVIQQAFSHIQEALLPLIIRHYWRKITNWKRSLSGRKNPKQKKSSLSSSSYNNASNDSNDINQLLLPDVPVLNEDYYQCTAAKKEEIMDHYEGTFDDYLEIFVQFGYVVLFSSVYPIAAFWAVINNLIEIRADAFKLCRVFQRPMARRVKDIGAWQRSFEILGALSIMTNCGVLALSPIMQSHFGIIRDQLDINVITDETASLTDTVLENGTQPNIERISGEIWILTFVALEHILLGLRFILHKAIPDRPEWVRIELARRMYESRKALKHQKNQKNQKIFTRKFKTVHGPHNKNM